MSPTALKPASQQALQARIAELEAALVAKKQPKITLKVSGKGALSLYGLGRFPITLYREQWEAVLAKAPDIKAFIEAHASSLKTKE